MPPRKSLRRVPYGIHSTDNPGGFLKERPWVHPDTGETRCGADARGHHCNKDPFYWPGTNTTNYRCASHGGKSLGRATGLHSRFAIKDVFPNAPELEDSDYTDMKGLIDLQYARFFEQYDKLVDLRKNGGPETKQDAILARMDALRNGLLPLVDRQQRREEELGKKVDRAQAMKNNDLAFAALVTVLKALNLEEKKLTMAYAMIAKILDSYTSPGDASPEARMEILLADISRSNVIGPLAEMQRAG